MDRPSIAEMSELLVPLDGSEASKRSVPVAGRLADRLGVAVRLFTVGAHEDSLRDVADRLLPGRAVKTEAVPGGDAVDAIVTAAGGDRVVCMATAASLFPHRGHVGSVAEGVVRGLGRPVFLVGPQMEPHPGEHTQRAIVPVDGSKLSEAALDIAGDLASALDIPVWVVSCVGRKMEAKARSSMGSEFVSAQSGYVLHLARDLARRYGITGEYEMLHDEDPAKAIVDFAGDDGTIVMSTHGRSGLSRVFGGSVATGVVAHSPRAVMVWRPTEVV